MSDANTNQIGSEILSKGAFLYGSTIVNVILGYLSLYLAAKYVGLQELGIVVYALSFAGLFTFICDFGINRSHTKKVSEGADLQSCLSVYLVLRLGLTALYALAMIGILLAGLDQAEYAGPGNKSHVMLLAIAYCVPSLLTSTFVGTYLAKRDVIHSQIISVSESVLRIAALIAVILLELSVIGLALTWVVAGIGSLIVALVVSWKSLPHISLRLVKKPLMMEYVRFALPLAVAVVVGTVALNVDKVIIQVALSSEDTAIYYGAQRILGPLGLLSVAMVSLIFPAISQLNARLEDKERIGSLVNRGLDYLLLVLIPATAFLAIFSKEILIALLSVDFEPGSTAFSLLAIAYALSAITTFARSQLLGTGLVKEYAKLMLLYFVTIILLDVVLIPEQGASVGLAGLGMVGAGIALLVAESINLVLFYRHASKESRIELPSRVPRLAAASGGAILVAYVVSLALHPSDTSQILYAVYLIAYLGIYAAVFLATALMVKATNASEIRMLMRALDPRRLKEHRAA